jgi:hypothetical protein
MIEVKLPIEAWQQVLAIIARAPWAEANPLIMGIGEQLRVQGEMAAKRAAPVRGNGVDEEAAQGGRTA